MADERPPGFLTEDLELQVSGGPPRYRSRTEGPVEYIAIADMAGAVVGFFYANDDDPAAGGHSRFGTDYEANPRSRVAHGRRSAAGVAALMEL